MQKMGDKRKKKIGENQNMIIKKGLNFSLYINTYMSIYIIRKKKKICESSSSINWNTINKLNKKKNPFMPEN